MNMRELDVIVDAMLGASRIVMGDDADVESKDTEMGVFDVVTSSDVRAEKAIIVAIKDAFPDDVIISEETNPDAEMGDRCWAIDPIDGTMNFTRGIPLYGMQAVFMEHGVPKASCIYFPTTDEMYTASEDGAFLNGEPIHTACARPLRECILSLGDFSRKKESYRRAQAVVMSECYSDVARFKVMGAACVDFAYLADARTDIHLRFVNRIWDFMPGLYLAQKAGAVYDEGLMQEHSILVLCSCREVLDEAVGTLVPRFISCFRQP